MTLSPALFAMSRVVLISMELRLLYWGITVGLASLLGPQDIPALPFPITFNHQLCLAKGQSQRADKAWRRAGKGVRSGICSVCELPSTAGTNTTLQCCLSYWEKAFHIPFKDEAGDISCDPTGSQLHLDDSCGCPAAPATHSTWPNTMCQTVIASRLQMTKRGIGQLVSEALWNMAASLALQHPAKGKKKRRGGRGLIVCLSLTKLLGFTFKVQVKHLQSSLKEGQLICID